MSALTATPHTVDRLIEPLRINEHLEITTNPSTNTAVVVATVKLTTTSIGKLLGELTLSMGALIPEDGAK